MQTHVLGRSGIAVSELCLGAMMFGAWGNTDHDECIAHHRTPRSTRGSTSSTPPTSTRTASRRRSSARALQGRRDRGHRRDEVRQRDGRRTPITAGGSRAVDHPGVRRQPAAARHRLHRPVPDAPPRPDVTDIDETLGALNDLVHQGKVRSDRHVDVPGRAIVEAQWSAERRGRERFVCEQPPYSILARAARARGAPDLRALRHGRDPVEPAQRRLADRQVPARRRDSRRLTRSRASRAATPCTRPTAPPTSASSIWSRSSWSWRATRERA